MARFRTAVAYCLSILIFLLPSTAFSTTIDTIDLSTELYLGQTHEAHTIVAINYENLTAREIYYVAYSRVSNLIARDPSGPLECETKQLPYGTAITCTPNTVPQGAYTAVLEYDEDGVFTSADGKYLFLSRAMPPVPTREMNFEVKLPPGLGVVTRPEGTPELFPEDAEIRSDGRHIIVTWTIQQPEQGKTYMFRVTAEEVGIQKNEAPLFLVGMLAVALVGVSTYVVYQNRKESKSKNIIAVLKEDEKKILEVLAASGGECIQKKIVRETGFSKAKVSRIIVELVERGLIQKEPKGRTNIVRLVDKTIASMITKTKEKTRETRKEIKRYLPGLGRPTSS